MIKRDYTLIEEGKEYYWGTIVPGGLQLPEDRVAICWNARHHPDALVGWASAFRREGNQIIASLAVEDELFASELWKDDPLYYAGPFVNTLVRDESRKIIRSAVIKAIDIFPIASYPHPRTEG